MKVFDIDKKYVWMILGFIIFPLATVLDYYFVGRYTFYEYVILNLIELLIFFFGVMTGESWMLDRLEKSGRLKNE